MCGTGLEWPWQVNGTYCLGVSAPVMAIDPVVPGLAVSILVAIISAVRLQPVKRCAQMKSDLYRSKKWVCGQDCRRTGRGVEIGQVSKLKS